MFEFLKRDNNNNNNNRDRDACCIPNTEEMQQILLSGKPHTRLYHLIYALIISVFFFSAIAFPHKLIGLLCMFICPAMLVYTYLLSPIWMKYVATFLAPAVVGILYLTKSLQTDFVSVVTSAFIFILCIAISAIFTKSAISNYRKDRYFVLVTFAYGVLFFCFTAVMFIYSNGFFSLSALLKAIDSFFDTILEQTMAMFEDESLLSYYKEATDGTNLSDAEFLKLLKRAVSQVLLSAKALIPAMYILTCMLFSFISCGIFTRLARKQHIPLFISINDTKTRYCPTNTTADLYDLVFLAYLVAVIFPIPQNITFCILTVLLIMTPAFIVPGLIGTYAFFLVKTKDKKFLSLFIIGFLILLSTTLLSFTTFFLLGSIGAWFVKKKNNILKDFAAMNEKEKQAFMEIYSSQKKFSVDNKETEKLDDGKDVDNDNYSDDDSKDNNDNG